ncbi:hypothetical protein SAMN05661091_3897 [Paenibacillus uliginis N3/975]|uniref:Uncharacterized protein n=1 Tax=Paenibacillus uliginis N3/975 TaxID=1313296 RepID=A0A1X7HJG0_9BACL|nr:hypothetical protein SAMN05661091_3897 [Paenibacillus uliginis N3/975]
MLFIPLPLPERGTWSGRDKPVTLLHPYDYYTDMKSW